MRPELGHVGSDEPYDLWLGHRASDALITCGRSNRVATASWFSSWPRAEDTDGSRTIVEMLALERHERRRSSWTSKDQSVISAELDQLLAKPDSPAPRGIVPFCADPRLEQLAIRTGVTPHALPFELFGTMSAKSFLLAMSEEVPDVGPGIRVAPDELRFDVLERSLGLPFLLKTEQTAAGKGVYLIDSSAAMDRAVQLSSRHHEPIATAWSFLEGDIVNVHFLVSDDKEVVVFPPSRQIVRRNYRAGTLEYVGNDFALEHLEPGSVRRAIEATRRTAAFLAEREYCGIGGVDVVATPSQAWVIDLNPRFQGSSMLLSLALVRNCGVSLGELQRSAFQPDDRPSGGYRYLESLPGRDCGRQLMVCSPPDGYWRATADVRTGVYARQPELTFLRPIDPAEELDRHEIMVLDPLPHSIPADPATPIARIYLPPSSRWLDDGAEEEIDRSVRQLLSLTALR